MIPFRTLRLAAAAGISLASAQQEAAPVRTVVPKPSTAARSYEVPGRAEPIEFATIFTRATGIVRERMREIGERVDSGDVLAVVDAPEIDRAVDAAKAGVEQAVARATNDKKLFDRTSRLLKSEAVSAEESEQRQLAAAESAAAVRVAQAELARLEELQRFSTVRAPFDGVISARNVDRGDHVRGDSAGTDEWLYQIARLDTLRFVVNAAPDLAFRLSKNTDALVSFPEFPGKTFTAKVAHSSRIFDTSSGTMRIELLLDNKDLSIPAGLTGYAQFHLVPEENTYLVPTNALVLRKGKSMAAVVQDGKAKFIEVLPGKNFGAELEITSSELTPSTQVILNPNAMLRDGDAVSPTALTAAK